MSMKENTAEWKEYMRLFEERPQSFRNSPELEIILDPDEAEKYEKESGRVIGVVYKSPWRIMVVDLVKDISGRKFAYERLLPAVPVGAVVTIPVYEGRFVLLEQFRHALRGKQWSFPRGFAEDGLSFTENAAKELGEELHARVKSSRLLGSFIPDSSLSGDKIAVVLCEIDSFETVSGYEEITSARAFTAEELDGMIRSGEMTDCFTMTAYLIMKTAK